LASNLKLFDEGNPKVAAIYWNNSGVTWRIKVEYDKAIAYSKMAYEVFESELGDTNSDTQTVKITLEKAALQQNLWVDIGSGNAPRV